MGSRLAWFLGASRGGRKGALRPDNSRELSRDSKPFPALGSPPNLNHPTVAEPAQPPPALPDPPGPHGGGGPGCCGGQTAGGSEHRARQQQRKKLFAPSACGVGKLCFSEPSSAVPPLTRRRGWEEREGEASAKSARPL